MSVHVLLNLLKELGKRDKISVPRFFAMSLIYLNAKVSQLLLKCYFLLFET